MPVEVKGRREDSRQLYEQKETQQVELIDRILSEDNIHKYAREEDRPEHTIFVITTDGMENASHRYSSDEVKAMVRREKEQYGWEFLFLGANIDAVETAVRFGIGRDRAVNFHSDSRGQALNYRVVSEAVCQVRCNAPLGADWKDEIQEDFLSR